MSARATPDERSGQAARAAAAERRAHARHHFLRPPLIHFRLQPSFHNGAALVHDLCAHGMGLVVAYRLEPGAVLLTQLWASLPGTLRTRLARVVHATPLPDGTWRLGCRFTPPLSAAELAMAVQQDH
jgi:hypothetical protein